MTKLVAKLDGKPIVRRVVEAALAAKARPVVVVTGYARSLVEAAVADLDVELAFNPKFASGLASSLSVGLSAMPGDVVGALVLLGDMPWIEPRLVDALIDAFLARKDALAAVPSHERRHGNPVLLGRGLFEAAMRLQGDQGARRLIGALSGRIGRSRGFQPGRDVRYRHAGRFGGRPALSRRRPLDRAAKKREASTVPSGARQALKSSERPHEQRGEALHRRLPLRGASLRGGRRAARLRSLLLRRLPQGVDFVEEPPVLTPALGVCGDVSEAESWLFASCGEDGRRERNELRQFSQILGCGGQQELVFGSVWTTEAQSTQPEYTFEMSEQHLNLFSFAT